MVEWNTQTDREFHEYFPLPEDPVAIRQRIADKEPKRGRDFVAMAVAILGGCAIWALLAVFCWGGNLVPRW
jgi:hypothetical protein